ncbi:MAG TPA: CinA family protein [Caulobacteraceae bacterium]|jgi:nicotinamide-nucleotide amidase
MFPKDVEAAARAVLDRARARGWTLAAAESCTGGLVVGALTEIAGSSDVVDRGFVTYSNAAKSEMLGVDAALIERVGAVSEEVARAMAEGAVARSGANLAVSITGIAGPGGGSADKPVGLVHFATAVRGGETLHLRRQFGERERAAVRSAAVDVSLAMLLERLG